MVRDQGVPELYISILIKLYADQLAVVQADTLSRPFALSRGVQQGGGQLIIHLASPRQSGFTRTREDLYMVLV